MFNFSISPQTVTQVKYLLVVFWARNPAPLLHRNTKYFAQFQKTPDFPSMQPLCKSRRNLHLVSSKCYQGLLLISKSDGINGSPAHSLEPLVPHPAPLWQEWPHAGSAGGSCTQCSGVVVPMCLHMEQRAVLFHYKLFSFYFSLIYHPGH